MLKDMCNDIALDLGGRWRDSDEARESHESICGCSESSRVCILGRDADAWVDNQLYFDRLFDKNHIPCGIVIGVTSGGPKIEVHTATNLVIGWWGSDVFAATYYDGMGIADYFDE